MEEEIWKECTEFEYKCEISNLGRLKRVESFHKYRIGSITYGSFNKHGYLRACVGKKHFKIHRLVAKYFLDDYSENLTVNHIDFDKSNNKVSNLEMMTSRENTLDYLKKVRKPNCTSDVIGVYFRKSDSKWMASLRLNGKTRVLKICKTEKEAIDCLKNTDLTKVTYRPRGGDSRLTIEQEKELLSKIGQHKKTELSKEYGISYATIFNIIKKHKKNE